MTQLSFLTHRSRATRVATPLALLVAALLAVLPIVGAGAAQAPVGLGTADSFAVLAGSGITNTGPTTITGDVGTHPTPTMTGFGTVTMTGTTHQADAVALQAKNDLTTAYNTAAAATPTTAVPTELGGTTLTPGVYGGPTLGITGALTLDTLGDPTAVFIFQAGSTLITASNSSVTVLNGGTACNVFWQVGSSATLGTGSTLIGTVLADTSITAGTGATVQGRLLAQTGAVTLDTNTITRTVCAPPATTTTPAPPTTTTTTAPATTTTTAPAGAIAPGRAPVAPGGAARPISGGGSGSAGSPSTPSGAPGAPSGAPGAPGGGAATPGSPSSGTGSTPGDSSRRTGRSGEPGLPITGTDLTAALGGVGALVFGSMLLVASRLRRQSARRSA